MPSRPTPMLKPLILSLTLLVSPAAVLAADAPPAAESAAMQPAPVSDLVSQVDIPYEKFTLDNGLTVLVHEDRKTPVVAVSVWYGVGSKHEPKGETGYAHLFEHIMFNGSENAPDDYFAYLMPLGPVSYNGSTFFDRTNYYETVPRGALESVLFLESDRMGNLLGAVTQEKLDNQIAVVQNEKRQGDNQPYGLYDHAQVDLLFPPNHPYGHLTIGSMKDLSAASLSDMHDWFTGHYGPNNAVIVLAGDIDAAEARPLMEKWFGRFAPGPEVPKLDPPVPSLSERRKLVLYDQVPNNRITYSWAVPGLNDEDMVPLWVGAEVLGGLASSRLDNILVRDEQLAVSVSTWLQSFVNVSIFEITVDVKDGVDPDRVAARLDSILKDYIARGPSADEVKRVATRQVGARVASLERVSEKAAELAQGELYSGDPAHYRRELEALADTKPADVKKAMQRWLTRPVAEIRIVPGERGAGPYGQRIEAEAAGAAQPASDAAPEAAPAESAAPAETMAASETETGTGIEDALSQMPPPGPAEPLDLPEVQTATLANGATVYFARRPGVPVVRVTASFAGGYSADPEDKEGTAAFATRVMREGTVNRDSTELAEEEERLGADISSGSSLEATQFGVRALAPNLEPSVALLADIVRNPAFDASEISRVRAQQLSTIKAEYSSPTAMAFRILPPVIYGEDHPYGVPFSGTGSAEAVAKLGPVDLTAFHDRWIRPDNMKLFVVGDTTLDEVLPVLDRQLGDWSPPAAEKGMVGATGARAGGKARIIVFDRPRSPQSYIVAGQLMPVEGTVEFSAINLANDVLGGDFLSRINMDLREEKGWTYGARSMILRPTGQTAFLAYAPVQSDKTGPALVELGKLIAAMVGDEAVTEAERDRVVKAATLELPGQFETASAMLSQMMEDEKFGRPFDYAEGAAARYAALSAGDLDAALRPLLRPDELVWIIVGDADIIRPQLQEIEMPVEYRSLDQAAE